MLDAAAAFSRTRAGVWRGLNPPLVIFARAAWEVRGLGVENMEGADEASRECRGVSGARIGIVDDASPLVGPSFGLGRDFRADLPLMRGFNRCRGVRTGDGAEPTKPEGGVNEDPIVSGKTPRSSSTGDEAWLARLRHQQLKNSTRFMRLNVSTELSPVQTRSLAHLL